MNSLKAIARFYLRLLGQFSAGCMDVNAPESVRQTRLESNAITGQAQTAETMRPRPV